MIRVTIVEDDNVLLAENVDALIIATKRNNDIHSAAFGGDTFTKAGLVLFLLNSFLEHTKEDMRKIY